jgi:mevalonate kinase
MNRFYSNGKLLLSAEYLVLDGVKALALPTKFGQDLTIETIKDPYLIWESYDENNSVWFNCKIDYPILKSNINNKISNTLLGILKEAQRLNPEFLSMSPGLRVKTKLSFPINWGLGTSSTLINNIAQWAKVDAFKLLNNSFGGSGYDIACAQNNSPVFYQLINKKPIVETIKFKPNFSDQLYFIYLNKKQNSKESIKKYAENNNKNAALAIEISKLTYEIFDCSTLIGFEKILAEHEKIIASIIKQKPIQQILFSDYFGQTKSLGAWGGDFILATGNNDTPNYFIKKGFKTVIPYRDMIL